MEKRICENCFLSSAGPFTYKCKILGLVTNSSEPCSKAITDDDITEAMPIKEWSSVAFKRYFTEVPKRGCAFPPRKFMVKDKLSRYFNDELGEIAFRTLKGIREDKEDASCLIPVFIGVDLAKQCRNCANAQDFYNDYSQRDVTTKCPDGVLFCNEKDIKVPAGWSDCKGGFTSLFQEQESEPGILPATELQEQHHKVLTSIVKVQQKSIDRRFDELEVANKEIEHLKLKLELADSVREELQETMDNFSRSTGKRGKANLKRLSEVQGKNNHLLKEVAALEKENARLCKELDGAGEKISMMEKANVLLSVSDDRSRRELEKTQGILSSVKYDLGGKWRLLEAGEKISSSDEVFFIDSWVKVDELDGIGDVMKRAIGGELAPELTPAVRRKIIKG